MGDRNARIGNNVVQGVKHHFNDEHLNENRKALVDLCDRHNIRINNTFFRHKSQHKITWQNSRGQSSTIDYILSNRAIHATQILDVRSLTSANIGSDHFLALCKLRIYIQKKKLSLSPEKEKWNIESLNDPSTRELYQTRLYKKIESNSILEEDDVENSWNKIQLNVLTAANETIGRRTVNTNKQSN
ncbi:craniofacial development protein 2-like [Harmonia axyridis]|uniref:craniofacial development protein 2-like n=1 Tax=Harmonia axyridis TaxID=115357 RepID=UPI001E275555|nr:craniofacial development protein 2-like [Harmonia axyridis]